MMSRTVFLFALALCALASLRGDAAVAAASEETVRLTGEVPAALGRATRLTAPALPDSPIALTVVLRRTDQRGFEAFLHAVTDPRSGSYRHFLDQTQLAARFGPSVEAYDTVADWLGRQGFRLEGSANRLTITVHGTRGQVERALGVHLDDYLLGDRTFYANDRDPALPATIASHVHAIVGLSNLARPVRARGVELFEQVNEAEEHGEPIGPDNLPYSCWVAGLMDLGDTASTFQDMAGAAAKGGTEFSLGALSPAVTLLRYLCVADMLNMIARLAAGLPPGPSTDAAVPSMRTASLGPVSAAGVLATTKASTAGNGQKVGLVEFDNFDMADVQDFLDLIGRSSQISQLSQVHVNGGAGPPGADQSEVLLDIAAVMSLAPAAQVVVYDGRFIGRGSFQSVLNAMINDGVNVISNSWAYCEDQTTLADVQSLDSILASAAAAGISVVTGAGDRGSTCLNGSPNTVHVPASSPHITTVGGTTPFRNVGGTYGSETWWDGSTALVPGGQGGFGVSRFFARPSYQDGLTTSAMRSIPDVTAPADPRKGYFLCQASAGGCPTNLLYGGTSVAAPLWAAIVAVLNQQTGQSLGFLNPLLYPLAGTGAFHSASEMSSDFAHVGLGSPNVGELFLALTGGTVGPVDATKSAVGAFPPVAVADGTSQAGVAVIALDAQFNAVSGQTVVLTMNAGSHATITTVNAITNSSNGAALFTVTDTVPETVTFTASIGGTTLAQHPTVKFVTPPAAAGGIGANPTTVTANGSAQTTITVTLQDAQGHGASGKLVNLSQGNGHSAVSGPNPPVTDSNGQVQFTATDTITETVTYTATDVTDSVAVPGSAQVTFTNGSTSPPCGGVAAAAAGYALTSFATGFTGGCASPVGIAFDNAGNVFISNYADGFVYRFSASAGGIAGPSTRLNATSLGGNCPAGLAFSKDGQHLYVAMQCNSTVLELSPTTGEVLRTVASGVCAATGLATDPLSGDLFASTIFCGTVVRIANPQAATPTVSTYSSPGSVDGITFAPDGTLYARAPDGVVSRINGTNSATPGAATQIASVPGSPDGIAVAVDPSNPSTALFLFVNNNDGSITRVDLGTTPPTLSNVASGGSRGDLIAVGPDACLYATQSDRVLRVTNADGSCPFAPTSAFAAISLTPSTVSPSPVQGTSTSFTATLRNVANPADVLVTLAVAGANARLIQGVTDSGGSVSFSYTGTRTGDDLAVAFANVDGTAVNSNQGSVTWTAGKHSTYLSLNQSPSSGAPSSPVALIATLVDISATPVVPVSGATVSFGLAGKNCAGTTDASGKVSCSVTPGVASGFYPLTASFAGTSQFLSSNATKSVDLLGRVFDAAKLWVGLDNTHDSGTPFDVEVRAYNSLSDPINSYVAVGLTHCVTGLKPNATAAKAVVLNLDTAAPEPLAVRIFTRVGTNSNGTLCSAAGTHTTAHGLRLYEDSISQPSQVFSHTSPAYLSTGTLYLHTNGSTNTLNSTAPKTATAKTKDSAAVSFSQTCTTDGPTGLCPDGHNPWQQIGVGWSE